MVDRHDDTNDEATGSAIDINVHEVIAVTFQLQDPKPSKASRALLVMSAQCAGRPAAKHDPVLLLSDPSTMSDPVEKKKSQAFHILATRHWTCADPFHMFVLILR